MFTDIELKFGAVVASSLMCCSLFQDWVNCESDHNYLTVFEDLMNKFTLDFHYETSIHPNIISLTRCLTDYEQLVHHYMYFSLAALLKLIFGAEVACKVYCILFLQHHVLTSIGPAHDDSEVFVACLSLSRAPTTKRV